MRLICFFTILTTSFAWNIPAYFPKCCLRNIFVSDCLIRSAIRIKPYIRNGVQEIGLSQLHPLIIPINDDGKRENKIVFYGMHDYGIDHLEFYPQEILLKGKLKFKDVVWQADCELNTNNASTISNGESLQQLNITFLVRGSLTEKYSEDYVTLQDVKIKTDVEQQALRGLEGNYIVLRKNSSVVCGTTTFDEIFTRILKQYLIWFLAAFPYTKIFSCSK